MRMANNEIYLHKLSWRVWAIVGMPSRVFFVCVVKETHRKITSRYIDRNFDGHYFIRVAAAVFHGNQRCDGGEHGPKRMVDDWRRGNLESGWCRVRTRWNGESETLQNGVIDGDGATRCANGAGGEDRWRALGDRTGVGAGTGVG